MLYLCRDAKVDDACQGAKQVEVVLSCEPLKFDAEPIGVEKQFQLLGGSPI